MSEMKQQKQSTNGTHWYSILLVPSSSYSRGLLNRKPGMTFAEVMVTVVIGGTVVTSLLALQANLMRVTLKTHYQFRAVNAMTDSMVRASQMDLEGQKEVKERQLSDVDMKITYKERKPRDKKLSKLPGLLANVGTAEWHLFGKKYKQTLVGFSFRQPEPKKEEKS